MTNSMLVSMLLELKHIYHGEGCRDFDRGIDAIVSILSESALPGTPAWEEAGSIYKTMAGSKSGFSDIYIDRDTVEERIAANARLDAIRQTLWDTFSRT
jgi:hypothetical protein